MFKKYKNLIIIIISFLILFILFFIFLKNIKEDDSYDLVKIATCPTFYSNLSQLNSIDHFSVILTSSTSDSLAMLEKRQVDYALGGRTLMPEEQNFSFEIIGEGFSFLSDRSFSLYDYNLSSHTIYSDINLDVLKANFGDLNYQIVDNIYDYLEDNLIITAWENTDYTQAEIVHLLRFDNSRNIKSRIPIVYCQNTCDNDIIKKIRNIIN